MTQTKKKSLLGLILLAVIIVPTVLAVRLYRNLPSEPLAVGAALPHFEVEAISGAGPLAQQGRRVLLFFSPSCPHCETTIAQLDQLRARHPEWFSGDQALKWAFISAADKDETAAFASTTSWPVYYDANRTAMRSVRGVTLPYMVLVNEKGVVEHRHNGAREIAYHEALLVEFYQTGHIVAEKR